MGTWITHAIDAYGQPLSCLIEGAQITAIIHERSPAPEQCAGHQCIDAAGRLLTAGLIDVHVHLRVPGYEYKEDLRSGTLAAAKGGFTTVACMPNTKPVLDDVAVMDALLERIAREAVVRVLPYACISQGQQGQQCTDFVALKNAGAFAFTDDGVGVQSARLMYEAMQRAAQLDMPIVAHCEDESLAQPHRAAITDGTYARRLGVPGIPNVSEAVHIARDALLAEATGVHYHVCHVSTAQSVQTIREAKARGVRITAEVCPHHLLLSEEDIPESWEGHWKMNPPLRSPADVEAMIAGVEDGTIDCIVTDHAPHTAEEKARSMVESPFGIVGLETAFPLLYTRFVHTGRWTLPFLLDKCSRAPAQVFDLPFGELAVGRMADVVLIDTHNERAIDVESFASKGRNSPFAGWVCRGWPVATWVGGRTVWSESDCEPKGGAT